MFLPAHLAFVLLIDLNFIPDGAPTPPSAFQENETSGPAKERLRVQLLRPSDARSVCLDSRPELLVCDLDPCGLPSHLRPLLPAGESGAAALTKPASIRIWLTGTPHNHRAPPA